MVVQLSSLRVTAEMDVSPYTRAAQQKLAADRAMADASKAVGTALAQADARMDQAGAGVARLSSRLLDGYGAAAKFESTVRSIGRAVEKGMGLERAEVLLDAAYRKFGLVANSATLVERGFVQIAPVVQRLNEHYERQGQIVSRVAEGNEVFANAMRGVASAAQLAARGEAEYAAGAARVEAILQRRAKEEDAHIERLFRVAAANKAAADAERARVAAEGAQRFFDRQLTGQRAGTSAQQSAEVFEQQFRASEQALANLGRGVTEAARAAQTSEQQYRNLAAALDPLVARSQALARTEEQLNALMRQGRISREEMLRLMALEVQRQDAIVEATHRGTGAYRTQLEAERAARRERNIAQQQMLQTQFTINDVIASAQSGQKPLTILLQQGPQLTQVFAGPDGRGGIAGAIRALVTPTTLSIAAIGGLAVMLALAINRASELEHSLKALGVTLAQTGNATGVQALDAQNQAIEFARRPGVTRASAIEAAQGILSNPLISPDVFARALPLSRDFAQVTGTDIPNAARNMTAALTGGYEAARQLDKQFQFLSNRELDQIRNLEEQGKKGEASRIVLAGLERQIRGLADQAVTPMAAAANNLGVAWDNLLDKMGKSGPIQQARSMLIEVMNWLSKNPDILLTPLGNKTTAAGLFTRTEVAGYQASSQLSDQMAAYREAQRIVAYTTARGLAPQANAEFLAGRAGAVQGSMNSLFALAQDVPEEELQRLSEAFKKAAAAASSFAGASRDTKGALTDMSKETRLLVEQFRPLDREQEKLENNLKGLRDEYRRLDAAINAGTATKEQIEGWAAVSVSIQSAEARLKQVRSTFQLLREENNRAEEGRDAGLTEAQIARREQARQIAIDSTARGRTVSQDQVDPELRRKEMAAFVAEQNKSSQEARNLRDLMNELDDAIQRTTNPARLEEFKRGLQAAGQGIYDATRSIPGDQATYGRLDAQEIAGLDRRQRALQQAEIDARRSWADLPRDVRDRTDLDKYIADFKGRVLAQIGQAAKDLYEDLDAGNRNILDQAQAYTKGLAEAYAEAARIAGREAERTQSGVSAAAVAAQKAVEQALQGLQALRAGGVDIGRQADAQERLAAAEGRGVAAVRDAERANQVLQFSYDARARAVAALAIAEEQKDERAIARAKDIIALIDKETEGYDRQIKRIQEAQRTRDAIQLNRQFDPQAQLKADLDKISDAMKTGEIGAVAYRNAMEDAFIKAGRASSSFFDGAIAGLMDFARQSRNIGDAIASVIVGALQQGTDTIARLMLGLSVNVKTMLADLRLALMRAFVGANLTGPLAGLMAGGLGFGGSLIGGGASPIMVGGVPHVPVTGAGGGGFNLFGGGGFGDIIGGIRGAFGPGGIFGPALAFNPGSSAASLAGAMGGAGVAGGVGGLNWMGGLGGLLGAGLSFASGNPIGGIAGMLGAGLSLIPGLGPIGGIIGALGGLLGGLFGKKPKAPQGVSNLFFDAGAWSSSVAMNRGSGNLGQTTSRMAGAVGDIIGELTGLYGLGLGAGTPGGFIIRSQGKKTGDLTQVGLGSYANPMGLPSGFQNGGSTVTAAYSDPQQAIAALAAMIVRQGAAGGTLTGLSATQQQALRSEKLLDIESIKRALDFGPIYDDMQRGLDTITANEKAHRELVKQYRAAEVQAKEYGLSVDIIRQRQAEAERKMVTDFNDTTRRALLGINDPDALAREDLTRAQEARRKEAEYLESLFPGLVNFADLIALNNRELVELEKTLGHANDNIRDAIDRLNFDPGITNLTTRQQYDTARGEYLSLARRAVAGDPTLDRDRLIDVGDNFLGLSRSLFSITGRNASDITLARTLYEWMLNGGTAPNIPGMASGGEVGAGMVRVGEYGPELLRLSQPAQIYSRGDTDGLVRGIGELVALTRGQAAMIADLVRSNRRIEERMSAMERQAANDQSYRRAKGMAA